MPVYSSSSSSSRNRQDEKLDGMKGRRRTKKTKWSNNTTNTGRNTCTHSVADNDNDAVVAVPKNLRPYNEPQQNETQGLDKTSRKDRQHCSITNTINHTGGTTSCIWMFW